jgi:hypothetical protein
MTREDFDRVVATALASTSVALPPNATSEVCQAWYAAIDAAARTLKYVSHHLLFGKGRGVSQMSSKIWTIYEVKLTAAARNAVETMRVVLHRLDPLSRPDPDKPPSAEELSEMCGDLRAAIADLRLTMKGRI